eukprot:Lankesteria_metandrocarpae@DN9134_c0_g1_i1.p1
MTGRRNTSNKSPGGLRIRRRMSSGDVVDDDSTPATGFGGPVQRLRQRLGTRIMRRARSLSDADELGQIIRRIREELSAQGVKRIYVTNRYRLALAGKSILVLYMSFVWYRQLVVCDWSLTMFFKYITMWGYTIELIYFAYALYLDFYSHYTGHSEQASVIARTSCHALSELAFALQFVVTLFFWTAVYPNESWRPVYWEVQVHGLGLVFLILDYLYRTAGFSLKNHRYILAVTIAYSCLHIAVVLHTGTAIYPGLNFNNVYSYVLFVTAVSTIVFAHKIAYLISNWAVFKHEMRQFYDVSRAIAHEVEGSTPRQRLSGSLRKFGSALSLTGRELSSAVELPSAAETGGDHPAEGDSQ